MSNAKKVLSILLAVAMVVCLSINAFAAVSYETDATMTQTWTLSDATEVNSTTYTVDVSLTTNYPTGSIQFVVNNTDNTNVQLTGATLGAGYPAAYAGEISFSNTTGKVMIIVGANENTLPGVAIDGVIATLTYTYSGTGSATLEIADAPKAEATPDGTLIAARLSNGNAITGTEIVGQDATVSGSASIGAVALPPELVAASGYESNVIISANKTFGSTYDGAVFGFTGNRFTANTFTTQLAVTNSGTMKVTKAAKGFGTGTTIQIFAASDAAQTTPIATYMVIMFGDIDGSGTITGADTTAVLDHFGGVATLTTGTPAFIAADIATPVRRLLSSDTTKLLDHFAGTSINQNTVGALHTYAN